MTALPLEYLLGYRPHRPRYPGLIKSQDRRDRFRAFQSRAAAARAAKPKKVTAK